MIATVKVPTEAEIARLHRKSAKLGPILFASRLEYRDADRVLAISLKSGVVVLVPIDRIAELAAATDQQLHALELRAQGSALHQGELDVDMSIPNLVRDVLGIGPLQQVRAGKAKSPTKIAVARANGAEGGRPKKAAVRA